MTDDTLKLPRQARDMNGVQITAGQRDGRATLEFSLSSEAPVERWWGTEILSHEPGAVRMDRIDSQAAPLLFNHDWDDPIGMIESGRIESGRIVVKANLFDTARANEVRAMIEGGLRNVSIGYEIHTLEEDVKKARYTATDWTPLEASIVTVPADISVGVGRSEETSSKPVRINRTHRGDAAMANEVNEAAAAAESSAVSVTPNGTPEQRATPMQIEQGRHNAITNLAKANNLDERMTHHWISSGASLEEVSTDILKVMAERSKSVSVPAMLDMTPKEVSQYSVVRAVRAALSKDWSKAGLELEAHKAVMSRSGAQPRNGNSFFVPMDVQVRGQRDMTVAGVSGSQYLVTTQNQPGAFIDLLRNDSVVLGLGATRLTGLTGNITIPRMTAGGTAYWLGDENTTITESQATLGQVSLTPKNVAALTEITHQLIQQSDPSVEQLVMNDLAQVLALAVDVACLRGSGGSGQPQGIVGTSGVGSFDTDSTNTYSDVLDAQVDVAAANALRPGCAYVADPASAALLLARSRFASTDTPVWDGNLLAGTMAGFPAKATNQMSANTMLFGWWPSIIVAEWGMLELAVNPFSDFTRGLSQIRAWYTMDTAMRYPAAFSYDSSVA